MPERQSLRGLLTELEIALGARPEMAQKQPDTMARFLIRTQGLESTNEPVSGVSGEGLAVYAAPVEKINNLPNAEFEQ